jgi:hypothetical protein
MVREHYPPQTLAARGGKHWFEVVNSYVREWWAPSGKTGIASTAHYRQSQVKN